MDDHPLNKLKSFSHYKSKGADYFQSVNDLEEFNDHLEQLFTHLDGMLEVILGELPDKDLRASCQHQLLSDLKDDLEDNLPKTGQEPSLRQFDAVISKWLEEASR